MGASPEDRRNLAPVDVREHSGWLTYIKSAFLDTLAPMVADSRGIKPERALTVSRVPLDQRPGVASGSLTTARRGQMSDIPTPQALIRQVTGIGAPGSTTGR